MKISWLIPVMLAVGGSLQSTAETVKDREGAVRNDRATMEQDTRWIYNDFKKGLAEGKRTGKPVLVVLRCIPCLACAGIDAAVLLQESELTPLLDQFVCVRVINANALDLSLFQVDYDLSFSTVFFNGDGTIYGRYGSWTHQKNSQDKTTTGYKRAIEAALALHKGYPANQASLAGKQGQPSAYQTPLEIPTLAGKYRQELDWNGKVVPSCVHCHQIGDALRVVAREKKELLPLSLIYPWPAPEALGLTLAPDQVARIEAVTAGSIAARAGLVAGDELVSLGGQVPISIADVAWVLHRAPDMGKLPALIKRDGREKPVQLDLPADWRMKSDISRRVGTWEMRAMATGGLLLEDLPDAERGKRGLGQHEMALLIKHVGQYGKHATAKKAGFEQHDVVVAIDGLTGRASESEVIGHLLRRHQAGETVKATVLRGPARKDLELPMQ